MSIEAINLKLSNGEALTREEKIEYNIYARTNEVSDYDLNIEMLQIEQTLAADNEAMSDADRTHIAKLLTSNQAQRAKAANSLAALIALRDAV